MKKLTTIITIIIMLLLAVSAAGCSKVTGTRTDGRDGTQDAAAKTSYEDTLFDTSRVHTIVVAMTEEDRADQLAAPTDKTKYEARVTIDGEELESPVSFSTKGNSSLFFTESAGKDKYSYKINFGKYDKDQSYHGLDKLSLQNGFFSDAAMMKDYMAYWLFRQMDVDAPLASYAWLTVNGEDQGLYTAVEAVEDSFLERTKAGEGTLYEPEAEGLALDKDEMESIDAGSSAAKEGTGGADLVYRGDDEESYPDIFTHAETKDDEKTRERVIRSLRALSEKDELDKYLDTDEIIKYFAVHDFLVSYDSYTGKMLHNFYLYENGGKLAMLPWDYDSAYGAFPAEAQKGAAKDSSVIINTGIDSPLGGVTEEERPMWSWIVSDEAYLSEYHGELSKLTDIIDSGAFDKEAERVHGLIMPYIEKDPKAFYGHEDAEKGYETILKFIKLRSESVKKQLDGKLAARSDQQSEADRVDASGLRIEDMGAF